MPTCWSLSTAKQESQAVYFLRLQNVARIDVVNYISHGVSKYADQSEQHDGDTHQDEATTEAEAHGQSLLEQFTTNLNDQARQGYIDPLVGRSHEIERVSQVLARRRKNNPLLVGEAGVGKTAIAEGLAKMIVEEKVPDILSGSVVYCIGSRRLTCWYKIPWRF